MYLLKTPVYLLMHTRFFIIVKIFSMSTIIGGKKILYHYKPIRLRLLRRQHFVDNHFVNTHFVDSSFRRQFILVCIAMSDDSDGDYNNDKFLFYIPGLNNVENLLYFIITIILLLSGLT